MPKRKIYQLPAADRPREKLQNRGVQALSDFELLEVMIGNGSSSADVSTLARRLQKLLQKGAHNLTFDALVQVNGISTAQASRTLAAIEIAKRHLLRDLEPLKSHHDIITRLADLRLKQQEHFVCLSLDGAQRLLAQRTVTVGTLDTVIAHPREVFSDPIVDRAASIIVAHNHPSGEPEPSIKDIELTHQLVAAGQLLGVPLRDHIIIARTSTFSFRQHHLL